MAALAWPAANARLLDVSAPGVPDGYGDTAVGASIWAGSIEIVLKRERHTHDVAGVMETIERDVLVIRKPPPAVVVATPGVAEGAHTVIVEDRRTPAPYVKTRWHVVEAENRARGHESDSLRLTLRDPQVVP